MKENIQGKKELSVEEIEAQTLLELPDRRLMQTVTIENVTQAAINAILVLF
jgi:hypothetical protein